MEFVEFLVEAKKNTYAKEEEGRETILENGCREFIYEKGEFKYIDRYFGFDPFIGEEIVFKKGKSIWGMNYYGFILLQSEEISHEDIYNFLKKCLMKVDKKAPFRGPKRFDSDNFFYVNNFNGGIEEFYGEEKIFYKGKKVYQLIYHGGRIEDKKSKLV